MKVICSSECQSPELLELRDYETYTCCGHCDFFNKCIANESEYLCTHIKAKTYDANTCIQCKYAHYE